MSKSTQKPLSRSGSGAKLPSVLL